MTKTDPASPAAITRFWSTTEPLGWGTETTDYKVIEKRLLRELDRAQAVALRGTFHVLEGRLSKAIGPVVEGLGDDSFSDLLAHVIGLGRGEYERVLANPQLAQARVDAYDFEESFAYALPFESSYESLKPAKYLRWARDIIEAYDAIFEADDSQLPASWVSEIKADVLAVGDALRAFRTSKDPKTLVAQEADLQAAAERVDAVLSRLNLGWQLPEEGTIEDRLRYASNKWSVWNLISDIRQYLLD